MTEGPEILFDEAAHEYTVGRAKIPNVTGILSDLGFVNFSNVPPAILEQARARGSAIHAALHYYQENDLEWDTVDERIRPYIDAYMLFAADTGWQAKLLEHRVYSECFRYCGTLDGFGELIGLGHKEALIDIKSGIPIEAARWQTAAYSLALGKSYVARFSVHLKRNGRYQLIQHKDPYDVAAWKAIVQVYHLKNRKD